MYYFTVQILNQVYLKMAHNCSWVKKSTEAASHVHSELGEDPVSDEDQVKVVLYLYQWRNSLEKGFIQLISSTFYILVTYQEAQPSIQVYIWLGTWRSTFLN